MGASISRRIWFGPELVKTEAAWKFCGALFRYPDLHPLAEDYELFWKLYYQQREPLPTEPLKRP